MNKKEKKIGIIGKNYADKNYSNEKIINKWNNVYNKVLEEMNN